MNFTYMLMIMNLIYLILRDLHALKDNAGIVTEIVTKLEDCLVRIIGLDKMNIQLNHHEQERAENAASMLEIIKNVQYKVDGDIKIFLSEDKAFEPNKIRVNTASVLGIVNKVQEEVDEALESENHTRAELELLEIPKPKRAAGQENIPEELKDLSTRRP